MRPPPKSAVMALLYWTRVSRRRVGSGKLTSGTTRSSEASACAESLSDSPQPSAATISIQLKGIIYTWRWLLRFTVSINISALLFRSVWFVCFLFLFLFLVIIIIWKESIQNATK